MCSLAQSCFRGPISQGLYSHSHMGLGGPVPAFADPSHSFVQKITKVSHGVRLAPSKFKHSLYLLLFA